MKRITLNIITACLTASLLTGCEDFLETVDKNNSVESNFFSNKAECEQALYGCYNTLQANNYGHILLITESMGDNCYGGQGTDGDDGWDEFEDRGNLNMFENEWKKCNWGIHRCNFLLDNLATAPLTDAEKIALEAEAKFLRAYFNLDFVRLFGNVTLSTTSVEPDLPQVDPKLVYELIAKDLVFASENLPKTYAATSFGRATKWAAKSLLARAYLHYTGYYQASDLAGVVTAEQIRGHISDVIKEGGFQLLPDFRSLWPYSQLPFWTGEAASIYAGENNSEVVFTIKYTDAGTSESYLEGAFDNVNLATGNTWLIYMGPRQTATTSTFGAFHYGWGFCPVTPKLYNTYNAKDKRRDASIADLKAKGFTYSTDQKDYTGLWQQKYQPLVDATGKAIAGNDGSAWQYGQGQDYYAIRYADVLLMAAELYMGVDDTKAQGYFDEVRKRAFGTDFTQVVISKDAIFTERQLELAFEGIRYFDLLRYDGQNSLAYAKANLDAKSGKVITGGKEVDKEISFRLETKGLVQIPYNQINLSNVLTQNAGW